MKANEHLNSLETKLALCSNPAWLFGLNDRCQRHGQDFAEELRKTVNSLEQKKAMAKSRVEAARVVLGGVEPGLADSALESYSSGYGVRLMRRAPKERHSDQVAARNAIIQANATMSTRDICRRLDGASIQIPDTWTKKFAELNTWEKAYLHETCQKLVHKLISEAKRK
jgi:hypothetical protein